MDAIFWGKRNELVSESIIAEFEKKEKSTLPHDYKQFILETNGGFVIGDIEYWDENQEPVIITITEFYGFGKSREMGGITSLRKALRRRVAKKLLVIGEDTSGHMKICLDVMQDIGSVYLVLDSLPVLDQILVAKTFTEFMNKVNFNLPLIVHRRRLDKLVLEEVAKRGGRDNMSHDEYAQIVYNIDLLLQEETNNTFPNDEDTKST